MVAEEVLLALFITSITLFQFQEAEASSMAMASQNHCQRKCGDIDIPYPFGIDKGCYLDGAFRVTCDNSTASASLVSLQGEVDAISVANHTLRYKDFQPHILPSETRGESFYGHPFPSEYVGSHFWISHTNNNFIVMGSNLCAYLVDNETKLVLGRCSALYNNTRTSRRAHSSCRIHIPEGARNWTLRVDTMRDSTDHDLRLYTFVEKKCFLKKIEFSVAEQSFNVPVIYEWAVGNTSCNIARGRRDYACGKDAECMDTIPRMGYRCRCRNGYYGNPYLPRGCQDIDECAYPNDNHCPKGRFCSNTPGGYSCKGSFTLHLGLGIVVTVGLLIIVAFGYWVWRKLEKINKRKTKQRFFKRNGGLLLQQKISSNRGSVLPDFSFFRIEELVKATDNFSENRVLGKGGLGTVYKGMLGDVRIVAVKKANITEETQVTQFINEVLILSQINHRHIIKLLGCCLESEVPLIVYEYVSNGTLSHHIHDKPKTSQISWSNRLRVAAEIAGALAYLHSCASTAIFHRDIKSTNILLDDNYKAVISDFGLSRSISTDKTHLTTLVGGTFGYLDPDYFHTGQLNDKSDVYAFGVVLAEMLTGKRAISSTRDDIGLAFLFRSAVKQHCLFSILEEVVALEGQREVVAAVAKLAKRCLKRNARRRPCMKEVAAELDQLREAKVIPGNQEILPDEQCSISGCFYSFGIIDSEVADEQMNSKNEVALIVHVETPEAISRD